jgi:hypothetical protein
VHHLREKTDISSEETVIATMRKYLLAGRVFEVTYCDTTFDLTWPDLVSQYGLHIDYR